LDPSSDRRLKHVIKSNSRIVSVGSNSIRMAKMEKQKRNGKAERMLEELRSSMLTNANGKVEIRPEELKEKFDQKSNLPEKFEHLNNSIEEFIIDDAKETLEGKLIPAPVRKELVYLPVALQSAWLPRQGSPDHHVRKFKNSTVVAQQGMTPSGLGVGLPSGLMSRRVLLSLVSQAVMQNSRRIEIPSIKELLEWSGLGLAGQSHRSCQKNLFQMALMNVNLWYQPTPNRATVYKGNIFDELSVEIERDNQEVFSFIPSHVEFSQDFFDGVINGHSVPYLKNVIHSCKTAYQTDLMLWLHHRQSYEYLDKPYFLNYFLMREQFGSNPNQCIRKFKHRFKKELRVLIKEHGHKIDIQRDGIVLHPMKPKVPLKTKNLRKLKIR